MTGLSVVTLLLVKVLMTGLTVVTLLLVKVLMTGLTVVMYYYLWVMLMTGLDCSYACCKIVNDRSECS